MTDSQDFCEKLLLVSTQVCCKTHDENTCPRRFRGAGRRLGGGWEEARRRLGGGWEEAGERRWEEAGRRLGGGWQKDASTLGGGREEVGGG